MADNNLYGVYHGDDSTLPQSQTMKIEPERQVRTEPPPSYDSGPQQPNYPAPQQPYYPPQPQPAGAGYSAGYQQFGTQQTATTTTVVLPSQPCVMPMVKPPNYLVHSILSAIFCCPIFGIIGIVYAAQVDSAYQTGDYAGAHSKSSLAKGWTLASFVCGLIVALPLGIYFILALTVLATDSVTHTYN